MISVVSLAKKFAPEVDQESLKEDLQLMEDDAIAMETGGQPCHHRHGDGQPALSSSPWRRMASLVVAMETDGQPCHHRHGDGRTASLVVAMETDGQPIDLLDLDC